jgi:hypothetical protein
LIAYPELNPNAAPIATTNSPTTTGTNLGAGGVAFVGQPQMTAIRMAVPTT